MNENEIPPPHNKAEIAAGAGAGAIALAILFGPCCLKAGLIVLVVLALLKFLFS